jgi:hypothetical protein
MVEQPIKNCRENQFTALTVPDACGGWFLMRFSYIVPIYAQGERVYTRRMDVHTLMFDRPEHS